MFASEEQLSLEASAIFSQAIREDLAAGKQPALVLCGGNTPRQVYARLAGLLQDIDQIQTRARWLVGDERWVPPGHGDSNEGMIRSLLLGPLGVSERCILSWRAGSGSPIARARQYEELLKELFDGEQKVPDLLVLGLGEDGHTASLFPDGWAVRGGAPDPTRDALPMSPHLPGWTAAVYAPRARGYRLTMTAGFLSLARRIFFLVSGENKRPVLARVLNGDRALPAAWLNLPHTVFLVTRDAVDTARI